MTIGREVCADKQSQVDISSAKAISLSSIDSLLSRLRYTLSKSTELSTSNT